MAFDETLRKIGLSNGEVRVFSALLNLGSASISSIHEKTGIERRNIYDILNKLIGRGLVSYIIENKKKSFHPQPGKIISYIEEKKHKLDETKKIVQEEVPHMLKQLEYKPEVKAEVYRGLEGIKTVIEDALNCKNVYCIGGGAYVAIRIPSFWKGYNKRRIKLGVRWHNLIRQETKGHPITKEKLMYTKVLPKEFSVNPNAIWIFGNKVANILWSEDAFAFVIENKEIAENYKRYFEYLWNNVALK